jgi:hypothetical protein
VTINVDKYRKSILVGVGAFLFAAQAAISDGKLTLAEGFAVAIAVATALGVYRVPNVPDAPEDEPEEDTWTPEVALRDITW